MRGRRVLVGLIVAAFLAGAVPATVQAVQSAGPAPATSASPGTESVRPLARDSIAGQAEPASLFTTADLILVGYAGAFLLAVGLSARALLPDDGPL